jgi:flagellar L-ring protein precursor FlgH
MKKIISLSSIVVLAVLLLSANFAYSDSIWNSGSGSVYSTGKAFKVGDIITIIVLESTSALQKAQTDTNANDTLGGVLNTTLSHLGFAPGEKSLSMNGSNIYSGLGSTARTSDVTAKIAAVVVKILPNGNLMIAGQHRVEVNDEVQTIEISGMVRPNDVSLLNTVYSYQVAQASLSVKGKGVVGEAESPNVVVRFLNWLF